MSSLALADLFTALGLVLVIEGVLYAAMPRLMRQAVERLSVVEPARMRLLALAVAAVGVVIVALARG